MSLKASTACQEPGRIIIKTHISIIAMFQKCTRQDTNHRYPLPWILEETTDEGGREDAFKKLMNRTKFGSESLLITPFVYGTGKAIKAAATRGKRIEFSNSKLDQFFNKIF